jgi:TRAP-type C4-dicarboxylate transport system permease small subunit
MLRSALALLSSLQIGLRFKESVERSLRQAVVIAIAVVILIGAAAFGLLAAYQALIAVYGSTPATAAGIIAAALAVVGVLILATLLLVARRPKRQQAPSVLAATAEGVGLLDQGVSKAMQQVGPVTLLAIAFVAGILASRRR